MGNNLGGSVFSGVIGGIVAGVCWYIIVSVGAPIEGSLAAAVCGFLGSFFASMIYAAKTEKVEA
jgi:hypothetical protein